MVHSNQGSSNQKVGYTSGGQKVQMPGSSNQKVGYTSGGQKVQMPTKNSWTGNWSRGGGRGGGGSRGGVTAPQETAQEIEAKKQKAIEQKLAQQKAIELAKTRTQQALRGQQLVESLRVRQQITREAKERGRGFSRTEVQKRLKELGTSTTELRQATRASMEKFRKTGVSVTKQIKSEEEAKKESIIVKDISPRVTEFKGSNVVFSTPTNIKNKGEVYSKDLGGFVQADKQGQFLDTTAITRIPTIKEQEKIDLTTGEKIKTIKEKVVSTQIMSILEAGKVLGGKTKQKVEPVAIEFLKSQAETSRKIEERIKPVTSFISTQAQDFGKTNLFLSGEVKEKVTPYIQAGIVSQARLSENIQEKARDLTRDFGKTTLFLGQEIKQRAKPYITTGLIAQAETSRKIEETISPVLTGIKKQARDVGETNLFLYDTAKDKTKQKVEPVAIEFLKSQAETSRKIEEVTGIKDIKEIRKLNIEAKKRGEETFQFISRRGIEEVPTGRTWLGASLNVAGKSAEVLSLESGVAEAEAKLKLKQKIKDVDPLMMDMGYSNLQREVIRRRRDVKPTQKEIQESAELIGKATKTAIQLGIVDVPLMFGGGAVLSKAIILPRTIKLQKYKKYLDKGIQKVTDIEREFKPIEETTKLIRSETQARTLGERNLLKFKGKVKGELSLRRQIPTESYRGKVIERLKTGETGKGTVKLDKGKYKESVVFEESGIKKVTTVSKSGEGTIKLYKDGKLVGEFPLEKGTASKIKYKDTKIKSEEEERFGIPGVKKTLRLQEDKNILNIRGGQKRVSPTGIIRTEETGILRVGKTKGIRQEVIQEESVYDFSKVGLERKVRSIKRPGKSVTEKTEIGKKIVYGKEPETPRVDLTGFTKIGKEKRLFKLMTSDIDRTIVQKSGQRIITRFGEFEDVKKVSPGTTLIQRIKKAKDKTKTLAYKSKKQIQEQKQKVETLFIEPTKQFVKSVNLKVPEVLTTARVVKQAEPKVKTFSSAVGVSENIKQPVTIKTETTTPQITSITKPSLIDIQKNTQRVKQAQKEISLTAFKQPQRTRQVAEQILKTAQSPKVKQETKTELKQKTSTLSRLTQLTKLELKQKLTQEFARPTKQIPKKPVKPFKFMPFITEPTTAKKALKETIKKEFEVFVKKKGQDVSIGKAKTVEEASRKLSKRLKKTIAASGFIEEDGRILSVQETGLTNGEFRTSRLDFGRVVQRKTKRLGSKQETSQIQYFRKTKGGGGNLFGSSNRKSSGFF